MSLSPLLHWLEAEIFSLPSTDGERPLFNFYRDTSPAIERPDAARVRRENLIRRIESFPRAPDYLVIAEAPGWRGARFSGVPLISEAILVDGALGFSGSPTCASNRPLSEASASIFWKLLRPMRERIFTWNCIPLHPHRPGAPLSNRSPSLKEIHTAVPQLLTLIDLLRPQQVIAVGRCAERALKFAGISAAEVRHPAHGGAAAFQAGIRAIIPGTFLAPTNMP